MTQKHFWTQGLSQCNISQDCNLQTTVFYFMVWHPTVMIKYPDKQIQHQSQLQHGQYPLLSKMCCMFQLFHKVIIRYKYANTRQKSSYLLYFDTCTQWRTWWRSWLRHCATSRKVVGSIPDGVTGIFHWHNPSGRSMALRFTQPLTEMSTRNISRG